MSEEVRRTSRQNAGVKGARYGDTVAEETADRQERVRNVTILPPSGQDHPNSSDSRILHSSSTPSVSGASSTTRRSSTSRGSCRSETVRRSELDLEVEIEVANLDNDFDIKVREHKMLEFKIKYLVDSIDKLRSMEKVGMDEETLSQWAKTLEDLEKQFQDKTQQADLAKVDLEFQEKSLERKKMLLRKKGDIEKQKIIEEDENSSQCLSDDDDRFTVNNTIVDNNTRSDFHNSIPLRVNQDTSEVHGHNRDPIVINNEDHDDIDEDDLQLLERLRRLQDPTPAANVRVPKPRQGRKRSAEMSNASGTDQLAAVLVKMLERIPEQSSSTSTEKFLARQVHGKDLPLFYGRPEEWVTFITCYHNTTRACKYDDTDNLIRLQKCIRGDARKTVECLMSTPQNVKEIMQILETRYGQPDHIVDSLVDKATSLASFREDRLDCLIDFGMAVKNLTTTIISLNCLEHLNNPTLLKQLEQKLPVQLRLRWSTWVEDDSLRKKDLKTFCSWMERQTNAACKICPPKVKQDERDKKQQPWRDRRNERVLVATENNEPYGRSNKGQGYEIKCLFCIKSGHSVPQCQSFIKEDIESKWKWARGKRVCFGCLKWGHGLSKCRNPKECGSNGCKKFHHLLLHKVEEKEQPQPETVVHAMNPAKNNSYIQMMIIPITLKGPKSTISTLAMLDGGSSVTLLDEKIADQLGLQGQEKTLRYKGLHPTVNVPNSKSVDLDLITADGKKTYSLHNARTTNYLPLPYQSVKRQHLKKWKHLDNIDIKSYEGGQPKILIGLDNSDLIISQEFVKGPRNTPSAARTALGWVLCGKMNELTHSEFTFMIQNEEQDQLHQLIKEHFSTEALGVMVTGEKARTKEDRYAQTIMDNTIKRSGDRWESGLLWKTPDIQISSNKSTAMNRLQQMERKMDRDQEFAKTYIDKIQEYVDKGFARQLSAEEAKINSLRTFYLPHFMAKNPKKPKKLRFVFDAAAKVDGSSLNDALLIGPDQLTSMTSVLFKFRQRRIGITADIADMFHRVKIRAEDAGAQRFLWRGMRRDGLPDVYEMRVLIFGATCSPACAQEAKNKNAKEFQDKYPEAVKAIIERHYVDDYLDSCNSVEETVTRFQDVYKIHQQGGFNICKWVTSSSEVLQQIPIDLRAHGAKTIAENGDQMERVLGLFWRPDEDHFTFTLNFLKANKNILDHTKLPTKREVLALVMSIYDPLGFLSLFTVKGKIILQEIWRSKIGWDDEVAGSTIDKWKCWIEELKGISIFQVPRCYSSNFTTAHIQLHIFCDASEQAFGAVCYFRIAKGAQVEVSFVMSKARVAPLKSLSIPRMELQAALIGSRMGRFIQNEHEIKASQIIYWSDNKTVLSWITSDSKRYKQFVAHRVGEVQELTNTTDWRWVPTKENVADELTRDNTKCDWAPSSRWVNGPEFLLKPEIDWPREITHNREEPTVGLEDEECKREYLLFTDVRSTLIDINNFSTLLRLLRVTAYVFKIVQHCREKRIKRTLFSALLFPEQLQQASKWWWRQSQQDSFSEEIALLKQKKELPNSSRLSKLSPFVDEEGLLRIKGRLEHAADLQTSTKHPIILDSKHEFTKLLVMHYHTRGQHHGMERVANELRQRYYILNLRQAVKNSWNTCQLCKNRRAQPAVPEMAALPSFRLQGFRRPFTTTGLDYFGPMEVKVGRRHEKRYGALFTCLSTRAIHLEIATFLNTDSCIMALRRFVARRGCPVEIWSDNGTNFRGADIELKLALREFDQGKLTHECTNNGILWKFIPPAAPHMGGSWERMVRSVKVALQATLNERYPTDEVLSTLMVEAEHLVNCHPLTHVPVDPDDLEALTPNHFLMGTSSNVPIPGVFVQDDLCLRKQWRKAQIMTNHFWRRWVREYVPTLLRRNKWFRHSAPIQLGDVVLEVHDRLERNSWPIGIVVKLYPGRDNLVRSVDVKFSTNILRRPVSKLCVLDVRRSDTKSPAAAI